MARRGAKNPVGEDRASRIEQLKHRAQQLTGGQMVPLKSDDCPPEIEEEFWKRMVAFEEADWVPPFDLLEPGLRFLEERTGKPVLGVLPYLRDLGLEAEDSVSLETYRNRQRSFSPATVNVAVVCLPHIANFTDFLPLARVSAVTLNYVQQPQEIAGADVVILPGSKNTISDLRWLRERE